MVSDRAGGGLWDDALVTGASRGFGRATSAPVPFTLAASPVLLHVVSRFVSARGPEGTGLSVGRQSREQRCADRRASSGPPTRSQPADGIATRMATWELQTGLVASARAQPAA